jgi:hypothetical protein
LIKLSWEEVSHLFKYQWDGIFSAILYNMLLRASWQERGLPSFQGLVLPRSTFLVGSMMQILKLKSTSYGTFMAIFQQRLRVTEFTFQAWLGAKTMITKMMSRYEWWTLHLVDANAIGGRRLREA